MSEGYDTRPDKTTETEIEHFFLSFFSQYSAYEIIFEGEKLSIRSFQA
jgi:hypothetical protein